MAQAAFRLKEHIDVNKKKPKLGFEFALSCQIAILYIWMKKHYILIGI